jgi:hypothetical protein
VALDLFLVEAVGVALVIRKMAKKSNNDGVNKQKLQQIVLLLKFIKTIDDEEIIKATIESIIELLEEEISK